VNWLKLVAILPLFISQFITASVAVSPVVVSEVRNSRDFSRYQSGFLQILDESSPYFDERNRKSSFLGEVLRANFLKYEPSAENVPESKDCAPEDFAEQGPSTGPMAQQIRSYFHRCEDQMVYQSRGFLASAYRAMMIRLDTNHYPYGRLIMLHLPHGILLKGFLALKGDERPRPLVIIRTGIFGQAPQFLTERFLFEELFEQSQFNVLILENNTSEPFLRRNHQIQIGGYDEGVQNFQIVQELQSNSQPLSKIISEVHLAGSSMGGHGVFFGTLLAEMWQKENAKAKPLVSSSLLFCPLVDLSNTLQHMEDIKDTENSWIPGWIDDRFESMAEVAPELKGPGVVHKLRDYLKNNYPGSQSLTQEVPKRPASEDHVRDFWWLNDFWSEFENSRIPILDFISAEDPVVPTRINSENLKQLAPRSQVEIVKMKYGVHCSVAGAYFPKPLAALLQKYILSNSKVFKTKEGSFLLPGLSDLAGTRFSIEIFPGPEATHFIVRFISSKRGQVVAEYPLAFEQIGWAPSEVTESRYLLQRWLLQNLRFVSAGQDLKVTWQY
jgi:hypothetical protein